MTAELKIVCKYLTIFLAMLFVTIFACKFLKYKIDMRPHPPAYDDIFIYVCKKFPPKREYEWVIWLESNGDCQKVKSLIGMNDNE